MKHEKYRLLLSELDALEEAIDRFSNVSRREYANEISIHEPSYSTVLRILNEKRDKLEKQRAKAYRSAWAEHVSGMGSARLNAYLRVMGHEHPAKHPSWIVGKDES